jgi:polyisoprenoid-binding protein YceI
MQAMARLLTAFVIAALAAGTVGATPATYVVDPSHTYPSFAADHMGLSVWRGKFNRTSGSVTLDREAGSGAIQIDVDTTSVDFGLDLMNQKAAEPDLFDLARYPQATYTGRLVDFVDGKPTRATGQLTFRGVTRPVDLEIRSFKCVPHPLNKRELCGADAVTTIKRDEFGMDAGKAYGFNMDVKLEIQVEALRNE